jgi:two-component system, cell cycle sensor histidine kinase and response regulator CckA
VDDEAMVRDIGQAILQQAGYRVLVAQDGHQAVEMYRQEREQIHLIVLDLTMPRLSGRDTLRELRRLDPRVRVLLASGYSEALENLSGGDGVVGFIPKPYRQKELLGTVRAALDREKARED